MEHKLPPLKVRIAVIVILVIIIALYFGVKSFKKTGLIEASGTVEVREADISARIAGKAVKIFVDEGDFVKKDDVLIDIGDSVVLAAKEAAEAAYKNAKRNYERSESLYKTNSISKTQFEEAENRYKEAAARFAVYEDVRLKAPWDGFILERHVTEGETVLPNMPLFTIGDLKEAKITIYIPLPDLGKIKLNMPAKIKIDGTDKIFEGKITKISQQAEFTPKNVQTKDERIKEVFAVEITADNKNYELKPGMPCDVYIDIK